MIKYLILDMGRVLVEPASGDWLITNEFIKNVNIAQLDKTRLDEAIQKSRYLLDGKAKNLEEEYKIIMEFYKTVFQKINYNITYENLKNIVDNFVYDKDDSKYILYKNVKEDLEKLSKKYTILMLSDNWPCAFNYLKRHNIEQYFTKIYISSVYGERKKDKTFFDYPIKDFNIKENEALFIDDNEDLLDIAVDKGLSVLHMDRNKVLTSSKYKIIHDFTELL
ncbi:MAG: HAD hydrolase-like protein [Clostridia bacterium]|nr:HAD hydrolase-like protein [Clostridia bacterium]